VLLTSGLVVVVVVELEVLPDEGSCEGFAAHPERAPTTKEKQNAASAAFVFIPFCLLKPFFTFK
jgi:hypothetical protein